MGGGFSIAHIFIRTGMARARLGGSRTKLSGVVGDTLYSIIRNGESSYTQMVSQYAAERVNPNTKYQALYRMQVTLFFRALQVLAPIVQYTFEWQKQGRVSLNYFVSINSGLIQKDCKEHWEVPKGYFYPQKADAKNCMGIFQVSEGRLRLPKPISIKDRGGNKHRFFLEIKLTRRDVRMIDIRKMLGMTFNDMLTCLVFTGDYQIADFGCLIAVNLHLNRAFGDNTLITADNVSQLFTQTTHKYGDASNQPIYSNVNVIYWKSSQLIEIEVLPYVMSGVMSIEMWNLFSTCIFSKKKGTKWQRSSAVMLPPPSDFHPGDPTWEYGQAPQDVFKYWWAEYDNETYQELFG